MKRREFATAAGIVGGLALLFKPLTQRFERGKWYCGLCGEEWRVEKRQPQLKSNPDGPGMSTAAYMAPNSVAWFIADGGPVVVYEKACGNCGASIRILADADRNP